MRPRNETESQLTNNISVSVIENGLAEPLAKIASCWDNFCTTHTHIIYARVLFLCPIMRQQRECEKTNQPTHPGCFYGFWLRCLQRGTREAVYISIACRFGLITALENNDGCMLSASKYVNKSNDSVWFSFTSTLSCPTVYTYPKRSRKQEKCRENSAHALCNKQNHNGVGITWKTIFVVENKLTSLKLIGELGNGQSKYVRFSIIMF